MPNFVGLTLVNSINTASESLKARNIFIFQYFSVHEKLENHASAEFNMKTSFITSRSGITQKHPLSYREKL